MSIWSPTPAACARPADRLAGLPDPALERLLRRWLGCGLLAVCLVPALRGSSEWIGWWPMWLVGMPLAAWWALHRFQLPQATATVLARGMRRLRPHRQARRRRPPAAPGLRRRAA
ncbi:hypothetical protein [Pseudoxanthomonas jiangsuensis]|uniref:hypothetical protein n=1 Tax=Pseudoxanthomonas jiangsuensis TaxID=619688 RepID=UPI001FE2EB6A|nr:hypothetical protein [Pseudoxanthomonas jiangsuensis]